MDSYQRQQKIALREYRKQNPAFNPNDLVNKYTINIPKEIYKQLGFHTRIGTKYGGRKSVFIIEAILEKIAVLENHILQLDRPATIQELRQFDLEERRNIEQQHQVYQVCGSQYNEDLDVNPYARCNLKKKIVDKF